MTELPTNKTALQSIILKSHRGIMRAATDQKNCVALWKEENGEGPTTVYMDGKLSGIREALTILELEIANAPR
jgi:hypothetical protein